MTTIFISGSRTIRTLQPAVQHRIRNIVDSSFEVVVGDADGVDTLVQTQLKELGSRHVTVYCTGDRPRTNLGSWSLCQINSKARPGTRAFHTAKDLAMAEVADYGLVVWDSVSPGTLANILTLLDRRKACVVYLDKEAEALTVSDIQKLESLVQRMPASARTKADEAIGLTQRIERLKQAPQLLPI